MKVKRMNKVKDMEKEDASGWMEQYMRENGKIT